MQLIKLAFKAKVFIGLITGRMHSAATRHPVVSRAPRFGIAKHTCAGGPSPNRGMARRNPRRCHLCVMPELHVARARADTIDARPLIRSLASPMVARPRAASYSLISHRSVLPQRHIHAISPHVGWPLCAERNEPIQPSQVLVRFGTLTRRNPHFTLPSQASNRRVRVVWRPHRSRIPARPGSSPD